MENQVMCLTLSFIQLVMQIIFLNDKVNSPSANFPVWGKTGEAASASFVLFTIQGIKGVKVLTAVMQLPHPTSSWSHFCNQQQELEINLSGLGEHTAEQVQEAKATVFTCSIALFSLFMWLSKRGKCEKKNSLNLLFSSSSLESEKITPIAIFFFLTIPGFGPELSSDKLKLSSMDLGAWTKGKVNVIHC